MSELNVADVQARTWFDYASCHLWLEDFFIEKSERLEEHFYARMRRPTFRRLSFALVLLFVSVLALCELLFLTQTRSYKEAAAVCVGKYDSLLPKLSGYLQEFGRNSSNSDLFPREYRSTK
jgi:hypothetical protein